jgi:hypothetical protein
VGDGAGPVDPVAMVQALSIQWAMVQALSIQ